MERHRARVRLAVCSGTMSPGVVPPAGADVRSDARLSGWLSGKSAWPEIPCPRSALLAQYRSNTQLQ
jgi:hypothetical protein